MGIFRKNPLGILFRGWSDEAQSRAFYKSMDGINSHRPQQISFWISAAGQNHLKEELSPFIYSTAPQTEAGIPLII